VLVYPGAAGEARPLRPGETVLDRPRPEVTDSGGRIGRIWIRPSVTSALTFDDNVFADDTRRRSDLLLRIAPEVVAETDWRGHQASVSGTAERGVYRRESGENYLDLAAQAFGRVQVTRRLHASATARWTRRHMPRRAANVPDGAAAPTIYTERSSEVLAGHRGDVLELRARLRARRLDYDDVAARGGGTVNNDDLDRWEGELDLTQRARLTDRLEPFLRTRINLRRYAELIDDRGFLRDSYGHRTVGGVTWRPTGLTTVEAFGGVRQQIYADPRFEPLFEPTAGFSLTGSPTQLTSVSLGLDQTVRETVEPGASGRLVNGARARIDHELRRDLLVRLDGRYARDDYRGTDREDRHLAAGLSMIYFASRHLHARLAVRHTRRDSDGAPDRSFRRNRITLSLEVRY
jgi:hypothetical protein